MSLNFPDPGEADLVAHAAGFCRALRARGAALWPTAAAEAVRTLAVVDIGDRTEVYLGLRGVLATRVEEYPAFDELFERWWAPRLVGGAEQRQYEQLGRPSLPPRTPAIARAGSLLRWASDDEADAEVPGGVRAPSATESFGRKDFAAFTDAELQAVERAARRIARRLTMRPGRRWRIARRGSRIDMRRTIRASLRTGGEAAELARRDRKPRKTRLVAICDVSGSMDLYSQLLLQFLYALQRSFARVETFVFSTSLRRVTEQLAGGGSYRATLARLARDVDGWSGGTRIGDSLTTFVAEWSRLLDRRTVAIVLSDGWDTGAPETLGAAMREIHRRAGRVIWLNPLLGSASYLPLARGMQAALPHVDNFSPAHNLASLDALGRQLVL